MNSDNKAFAALLSFVVAAALAFSPAAVAQEDPIKEPIEKSGLRVGIERVTWQPLAFDATGPVRINLLTHAGDSSGRLFVGDMAGRIIVLQPAAEPEIFFDLAAAVGDSFRAEELELGLNSFAFHPDFASPGRPGLGKLYTLHSEHSTAEPQSPGVKVFRHPSASVSHFDVLTEWTASPLPGSGVDATSRREILRIEQPRKENNAGHIAFNPNGAPGDPEYGLLYMGIGDGGNTVTDGREVDADRHGQNPETVLGSIIRIDPLGNQAGDYRIPDHNPFVGGVYGLPEIWAVGLRNPQRFSWDRQGKGKMLVADIGQDNIEEINLGVSGGNYGWSDQEGTFAIDRSDGKTVHSIEDGEQAGRLLAPVSQYDHSEGIAVTAGFVYRGSKVPEIYGKYVFGDIANGRILYLDESRISQGRLLAPQELILAENGWGTTFTKLVGNRDRADLRFGMDEEGEIYLLSRQDGHVYQLISTVMSDELPDRVNDYLEQISADPPRNSDSREQLPPWLLGSILLFIGLAALPALGLGWRAYRKRYRHEGRRGRLYFNPLFRRVQMSTKEIGKGKITVPLDQISGVGIAVNGQPFKAEAHTLLSLAEEHLHRDETRSLDLVIRYGQGRSHEISINFYTRTGGHRKTRESWAEAVKKVLYFEGLLTTTSLPNSASRTVAVGGFNPPQWTLPLLGVVLVLLASAPLANFPRLSFWLLPLGLAYLLALRKQPRLWLLALPLATVAFDLTTWSGRFLYNEFDYLILLTIASAFLFNRSSYRFFKPGIRLYLVMGFLGLLLLRTSDWLVFISPPGQLFDNPYYMEQYGYKIIKGALWAFLLLPLWSHLWEDDRPATIDWLNAGFCTAALTLGLIILWERGTVGVLLSWSPLSELVKSVLDFSSSYRTTGIFSDMHTGGEVVDAVILLMTPITLFAVIYGSRPALKILAFAAFCSLAYCTLVGFTRATYAGFFIAVALFFLGHTYLFRSRGHAEQTQPVVLTLGAIVITIIAAFYCFKVAGASGLVAVLGSQFAAFCAATLVHRRGNALGWILGALGVMLSLYIGVDAHVSSRWVEPSMTTGIGIAVSLVLVFVVHARLFHVQARRIIVDQLVVLAMLAVVPGIFALAFGGYQFTERLTQSEGDLQTRFEHWSNVADSSAGSIKTQLIGNGVGSFPERYLYTFPETLNEIGSIEIVESSGEHFLRMGGGRDLAFGQRVRIDPYQHYTVNVRVRSSQEGRLTAYLCERNLIYSTNADATCSVRNAAVAESGDELRELLIELDSKDVGSRSAHSRWPTLFYIKNSMPGSVFEIDRITLSDDAGNVLSNSGFEDGFDHWFFYNDYAHLPWHIKNTWLQAWYDLGWIGFFLFLGLCAVAVLLPLSFAYQDPLRFSIGIAVLALCIIGFFGTPLDSVRVSWLFYFLMFVSLLGMPAQSQRQHG